jgi:formylglycine-generating enzyme required for sulfatase activity
LPRHLWSLQVVVLATLGACPALADEKAPKPGEVREFKIRDGLKMKFCWIPPGKAMLGSPNFEKERDKDEVEHKYVCKGFWLGKHPVTQAEWKALMVSNPSWFSKAGNGKDAVSEIDTDSLPAEYISWNECVKFLVEMNKLGRAEEVFGKRGKFVLPTEDEWEYACRGGLGNRQAFYFGDSLNGTQANCDGGDPYGTHKEGPYKDRTTVVGEYESAARHPWGLWDMHGNVAQWCENRYDDKHDYRTLRGGSWNAEAKYCRAAVRYNYEPHIRGFNTGFRICLRLDP